jgi:hypothetical protein
MTVTRSDMASQHKICPRVFPGLHLENKLEMQIFRSHPRPMDFKTSKSGRVMVDFDTK